MLLGTPDSSEHQGNGNVDTSLGNALWPSWLFGCARYYRKNKPFSMIKSELRNRQKPDGLFSGHSGDKQTAVCGHLI